MPGDFGWSFILRHIMIPYGMIFSILDSTDETKTSQANIFTLWIALNIQIFFITLLRQPPHQPEKIK